MAGLGQYRIGQPQYFFTDDRGQTYNRSTLQARAIREGKTFHDIEFEVTGRVNGVRMNRENYEKAKANNDLGLAKPRPPHRGFTGGRSIGRYAPSSTEPPIQRASDGETVRPIRPNELRYDVDGGIIYPIRPDPPGWNDPASIRRRELIREAFLWRSPEERREQDRIDRDKAEVERIRQQFAGVSLEGMVDDDEEGGNTAGEGSREIAVIPFYTEDWDDLSAYQKDIASRLLNKNADNWSDMMTEDWDDLSQPQKQGMAELGMDEERWNTEYLPITRAEEDDEEAGAGIDEESDPEADAIVNAIARARADEEEDVETESEEEDDAGYDTEYYDDEFLEDIANEKGKSVSFVREWVKAGKDHDDIETESEEEYEYNLGDTSEEEVVVDADEVVPEKTADEKIVEDFERELEEELRKPVIEETRQRINQDLERRAVNKFVPAKVGKKKGAKAFKVKKTTIEEDLADFDAFLEGL